MTAIRAAEKTLSNNRLSPIQSQLLGENILRYGMGYIKNIPPSPAEAIAWNEKDNDCLHEWSLSKRLFDYGFYDLGKLFGDPMKYLNTRADIAELIKEHVQRGATKKLEMTKGSDTDPKQMTKELEKAVADLSKNK